MKTFLQEVVSSLYQKYGEDISQLTIVFPNRRASLFFSRELSQVIKKAVWQPKYCSIDDLLRDYTGMEQAHELTLLSVLYDVYCEKVENKERFDSFYSWGQMLLADFDAIDKYMIDSEKLYTNMNDLQELDNLLGADFEQKDIILNFWRAVKGEDNRGSQSAYFTTFMGIWSKLDIVYKEFNLRLKQRGVGYSGMIYRQAAAMFAQQAFNEELDKGGKYIFVGFNALNKCESLILDVLKRDGRAEFYWDADTYYVNDKSQEAGLFLRKNISTYGSELPVPSNFKNPKQTVEVVNGPNDVMQCKALRQKLIDLQQEQGFLDSETAVVLTDENLLPVVLYSIPSQVSDINVTMGAALSQSAPYIFFERLMTLQLTRGVAGYYYDSVLAILSHEYIRSEFADEVKRVENDISVGQLMYIDAQIMRGGGLDELFPLEKLDVNGYIKYYSDLIERFAIRDDADPVAVDNNEFALALIENFSGVESVVNQAGIDISQSVLHSLLGKVNSSTRIPFEGYPLKGLQVMGVLESRCLDFKNVIVLSMCDETFPGNKASNSFIPPNLRKGFGLPTYIEHGAMWAYYFYRLISRAQNVTMMYSSSRAGNATGEKSRYIYQMEFESGHKIHHIGVDLHIEVPKGMQKIVVQKNQQIMETLIGMRYSPSSLNCYIDCPLKFYYSRLAKVRPAVRPSGDVEANESGSVLHRALELFYEAVKGDVLDKQRLKELLSDEDGVEAIVDKSMVDVLQGRAMASELQGRLGHLRRLIINQLANVVNYDLSSDDLRGVLAVEDRVSSRFVVKDGVSVDFMGVVDRRDLISGGAHRLVDYKSGSVERKFKSIESLFTNSDLMDSEKYRKHNSAALQMLIYSLFENGATPGLYALKMMGDDDFSPYLEDESTGEVIDGIVSPNIISEVQERLKMLFCEILNAAVPFEQTPYAQTCDYCEYIGVCNRQHKEI